MKTKEFKVGDMVLYEDLQANILGIDCDSGKEYATTYRIEIYLNGYHRRFWVHNKELQALTTDKI